MNMSLPPPSPPGFYHIAIAGDAIQAIVADLEARGLNVKDLDVDLGE